MGKFGWIANSNDGWDDASTKVFDTAKFAVGGEKLSEDWKADVDSDAEYKKDTDVVTDGIFEESKFRSAPYFDIIIDGITVPASEN